MTPRSARAEGASVMSRAYAPAVILTRPRRGCGQQAAGRDAVDPAARSPRWAASGGGPVRGGGRARRGLGRRGLGRTGVAGGGRASGRARGAGRGHGRGGLARVGAVETVALEHDADGVEQLPQPALALRALRQGVLAAGLEDLEAVIA